jgi:murein DD-endopeptidase MepM/ murein hydrolase activator NlpD
MLKKRYRISQEMLKKKMISVDGSTAFNAVNRDVTYLRTAASDFVRQHGVETQWVAQYDGPAITPSKQRRNVARRSRAPRHSQFVALDRDVRMLAENHRFIPPISPGLYWISSPYGPRRLSNGSWNFHYGIDLAAPYGTLVKAADSGVVIEAGWADGFGKRVVISHGAQCKTRYAHLSSIKVQVGDSVVQGQVIGKVGNSGHTRGKNGVHLHWEVIGYGGKRVNPKIFLERTRNS